jgi:hypothetical protein
LVVTEGNCAPLSISGKMRKRVADVQRDWSRNSLNLPMFISRCLTCIKAAGMVNYAVAAYFQMIQGAKAMSVLRSPKKVVNPVTDHAAARTVEKRAHRYDSPEQEKLAKHILQKSHSAHSKLAK